MNLNSAISNAASGLASINTQLALVSQNIANAGTPGYAREVAANSDATAGGFGEGVRTGPATRQVNAQLQASLSLQTAEVAGQQVRAQAFAAIDATQGVTAAGNDLASQVGKLRDAFTTLSATPDSQAQQRQVVQDAGTLARGINATANAIQSGRQAAQDGIRSDVTALNTTLHAIGTLSDQIIGLAAQGLSTADLENQRDGQQQTAAQIAGLRFLPQSNGDVLAFTAQGRAVALRSASGPFAIADATVGANAAYPGSLPALTLSGVDVTAQVAEGRIGANLDLRDTTLPAQQAGLDEFAKTLANRLSGQGLALFTDPAGSVPPGGGVPAQAGYVGFANIIQVNPAVTATPSLVRDGTQAVAGSATGASAFTPNPAGGPAGFTTLVSRITDQAFGTEAQPGVPQTAPAATGLGVGGKLSLPYGATGSVADLAASLVGAQSQAGAAATSDLATGTALQATLAAKLQSATGVSIDTERNHSHPSHAAALAGIAGRCEFALAAAMRDEA